MTVASLAATILADRERPRTTVASCECFACGRNFMGKPSSGDDSGRFCSARCRNAYDGGLPAFDPTYAGKTNPRWYNLPVGRHGFLVSCADCAKTFDSKGLRCCSTACERGLAERREIDRLKIEAGVEFESKLGPKRKCEHCGDDIPRWRKGRLVTKATRFCAPKCQQAFSRTVKGLA